MAETKTRDFSNTRCFIDFDSTIADSLPKYNIVLDSLVKGKLTDEHYIEYYQDFGDAYDIIPGSPWKSILMNLLEYHARPHLVGPYDRGGRWTPARSTYDVGKFDAVMKATFDADFHGINPDVPVAYYRNGTSSYAVVLDDLDRDGVIKAALDMPSAPFTRLVFEDVPEFVGDDTFGTDGVMDIAYISDEIVNRFEMGCAQLFPTLSYDELAIDPVIRFCREYTECGGHLIIHSGTNEKILLSMIDALDIADLFDDYLCSNMMKDADPDALGTWGYKTELLSRLLDKYPVNGLKDAVIGDTKGDAYGAFEVGLPFLLVWRGYPKDPSRLSGADNDYLVPNAVVSATQAELAEKEACEFDGVVEEMLDFMEMIGRGEGEPPARHVS